MNFYCPNVLFKFFFGGGREEAATRAPNFLIKKRMKHLTIEFLNLANLLCKNTGAKFHRF